jgi:predicted DCC family thiol-disulfide oxidoreductase YuxK
MTELAYPVAVMDGTCALCTVGARMIHRLDRQGDIRICPIQTAMGQRLLAANGLKVDDPDSWLFIEGGRVWRDFDALIRVGERSGGLGRVFSLLRIIPRPLRDWLYARIARNRYALFGRADLCALPDPALRARLVG